MSEELQNESIDTSTGIEEQPEVAADLAPDSEAAHEEQPQVVDEDQDGVQKRINKMHFEAKQAQREKEEALARLRELEEAERQRQAAQVGEIPPMPDDFDDDRDAKIKARDEAIVAKARFDAQQAAIEQQAIAQQQAQAEAQAAKVREVATGYNKRAVELGIKPDELQAAGNAVVQYGLSDDLVMHILGDNDGPLITKHLAANPAEAIELASMSPFSVGTYLEGVKEKAKALKPKTSNAPPPSEKLDGASIKPDDGRHPHIKGATFE